ncbi:MAG: hypoxanthine phosphoribosyltransferase [Microscillaceae bacterium]|jgi:hypoxanthine phosphoribosyltransferase|nr:hypoxanthine phosphoribosyltransferase [Microscillaceae bacterium]
MKTVQIKDKTFVVTIPQAEIQAKIQAIARQINQNYAHQTPILLGILNGSFRFMADLVTYLDIPIQTSFVKVASYQGLQSSGKLNELIGLSENIENQHLIIVEDIVDSGLTARKIWDSLTNQNPASLAMATLLVKPECLKTEIELAYVGFSIPNEFVVGYGLDYDGLGRELNDIYKLKD